MTTATVASEEPPAARRNFYLRRLHSITGVLPLGVFLVEHLWTNAYAVYGRESFNHAVKNIQDLPALAYVEVFGIFLPLAYHAAFGVLMGYQSRPNNWKFPFARNWLYFIQYCTGGIAGLFILLHLWQFRLAKFLGNLAWADFYHKLTVTLGSPGMFAIYFIGITATVFHFAYGLWVFGNTWGITVSERSMRRSSYVVAAVGLAVWVLGMNTLLHFSYRCGGVVPMPEQNVATTCDDPDSTPPPTP